MLTREETYAKAFAVQKERLQKKEQEHRMLVNAAYAAEPRLKEIETKQAALGAKLALTALSGDAAALTELKQQSAALAAEKKLLFDRAQVQDIVYDCPVCRDTGYVGGKICSCVKALAASVLMQELSAQMPLRDCRFDTFDLSYYPEKKDASGVSPRRRMTGILALCRDYVQNFSPAASPNLLFMGKTGLGKTHLTLAILAGVIEKGYLPIYGPAENLFSRIEEEKFSGGSQHAVNAMLDCDLLVIDDLGTEMVTSFTRSALYHLINTRLLSGKPTILNTNYSMKEIEEKYSSRISSRLIGGYDARLFLGDDIRQKKALQ